MGESLEQVMARYNAINLAMLPQISQKAIDKLRASKTNKHSQMLMVGLCLAIADGDEQLAQKIVNETNKTLETCLSYITSWARKQAIAGCAAIDHEDVWGEAIHYYLDVDEKKQTTQTLPVSVEAKIEKPVDDGSMSLFGDDEPEETEEPIKEDISISLFGDDDFE